MLKILRATRISTPIKRIAVSFLLSVLKLIIHAKRFLTAFFVKAVFAPIGWILGAFFKAFIIPLYRLYALADRHISSSPKGPSRFPNLLTSRYTVHAVVLLLAAGLVIHNLSDRPAALSSEDLVGQTLLARLVVGDSGDFDQPIEEYPRQDIALWAKKAANPLALLSLPRSLYTKQPLAGAPDESDGGVASVRTSPITYTVQNGDTISGIARRFGISANTILWENDMTATSVIKAGMRLTILPASGVSHTIASGQTLGAIASLYGVEPSAIMKANGITNPNQLRIGEKLVIPGGNKIVAAQTPARQITQSVSKSLSIIKNIIKPGPSAVVPAGDRMAWPTTGHTITQYFSWRHTGVDIANRIGTPIYAAQSGTVITAGWNSGGYGNQILILHPDGKKTRYGHLSAFSVNVGQKVAKGQYIAAMGSTGHSTGPHLHFEVIIGGKVYNPLNYTR